MAGLGNRHSMARHHVLDYSVDHSAGLGGGSVPHPFLQLGLSGLWLLRIGLAIMLRRHAFFQFSPCS